MDRDEELSPAPGRVRTKNRPSRAREGEESSPALLPIYLREMGQTPLLEKEQEVQLARELQEAREAMAKLALRLPAGVRRYVLQGNLRGPRLGHHWPLDELETFYDRLIAYARENGEPPSAAVVKEAKRQRRRMDHARGALILSNLRLVAHIAKKYVNHGLSFMDLIQEGNIGLMKAVEKFEYKRGHRFSTYAYWWIKQAIARAIADKARTIRIPVHVNEKMRKIMRVSVELSETLGRKPLPQEIARKLHMPVAKVEEILGVVPDAQSFEEFGADRDSPGLLQLVADPKTASPYEITFNRELKEKVKASLHVLEPREQEIVKLRFGIGYDRSHTLEDIGRMIRLSRERVRQIEDAALRKILAAEESGDLHQHFTSS
jgi:RNA polymerase sigma factor (sigma-70 family)